MRLLRLVFPALALASCRQLPELFKDDCGNGVVEGGEDCDLFSQHGSEFTCSEESCRYECTESPVCPPGRSCGRDGLCRAPKGEFAQAEDSPISMEAYELLVADLDADGVEDLIGGTSDRIDVRYGAGDGTYRETFSLPIDLAFGERFLSDIDSDGIQDVLVPYFFGVNAFLGSQSRRLIPNAHPSLDIGAFVDLQRAVDARLLVGQIGPLESHGVPFGVWLDGTNLNVAFDTETGGLVTRVLTDHRQIASASLADLTDATVRDELLIAIEGEDRLWTGLLSCETNCGPSMGIETGTIALTEWALGAGKEIDPNGALVFDRDADGQNDILVATGAEMLVLHGDGVGFGAPELEADLTEWPLAVGSRGGSTLIVLPTAVYTTVGSDAVKIAISGPSIVWSRAAVADFNGDGRLDVAVADDHSPSVAIMFRADPTTFNRIDIGLSGPPTRLSVGDYDGDGADDLACVVRAPSENGESRDEVQIVFGETSGPPADAIFMARFPEIVTMSSSFFISPTPWNPDRISDLVVELADPDRSEELPRFASILVGTVRRRMHAPIPTVQEGRGFESPFLARPGEFGANSQEDNPQSDLMALTTQGRVWMLTNLESGLFNPLDTLAESVDICDLDPSDLAAGCADLQVADLIPGAFNEALLVDRSARCRRPGPVRAGIISISERNLTCTPYQVPVAQSALVRTELIDVSDDGAPDIVLAFDDPPEVWIAFGGQPGLPSFTGPITPIGTPLDLAGVAAGQLAILTTTGLSVAQFGGAQGQEIVAVVPIPDSPTVIPNGARVLASRVDPDGLEDLLLGFGDRIFVFKALEAFEGGPAPETRPSER